MNREDMLKQAILSYSSSILEMHDMLSKLQQEVKELKEYIKKHIDPMIGDTHK